MDKSIWSFAGQFTVLASFSMLLFLYVNFLAIHVVLTQILSSSAAEEVMDWLPSAKSAKHFLWLDKLKAQNSRHRNRIFQENEESSKETKFWIRNLNSTIESTKLFHLPSRGL